MKMDDTAGNKLMKLPELAEAAGISNSTVYDYLRSGLLQQPFKKSPTKSFYTNEHLERLIEIREFREQGISISDLKKHYGRVECESGTPDVYEAVRHEIIDKALELFSMFHYDNTKISDITKELNIGSGTFYRYFSSKEELFLGCLERLPVVLVPTDAWYEVEKEEDFILRLKKRGYAMLNAFPSYIGILNYAKQALGGGDANLAGKAAECIQKLIAPLKKDLETGIKQGRVRKDVDVEMCAYLLLGINETFGYRTLIEPDYSVEYGFGVIEDFIYHALSLQNKDKTDYHCSCKLIDISGTSVKLEAITFNRTDYINGKYLAGELHVTLKKIIRISINVDSDTVTATIKCVNGDSVLLTLKPDDTFEGVASVGKFSISMDSIKAIEFENLPNA